MHTDETYTVSIWATAVPFPLQFALHTWFVLEYKNDVDRYEVWTTLGRYERETVFANAIGPYEGFRTSFFDSVTNPKKKSVPFKIDSISGGEGSLASDMYHFIKQTPETYPALHTYRMFPGPNSNTYVAWVLSHFPRCKVILPRRAFGKGWKLQKNRFLLKDE